MYTCITLAALAYRYASVAPKLLSFVEYCFYIFIINWLLEMNSEVRPFSLMLILSSCRKGFEKFWWNTWMRRASIIPTNKFLSVYIWIHFIFPMFVFITVFDLINSCGQSVYSNTFFFLKWMTSQTLRTGGRGVHNPEKIAYVFYG